MSPPPSYQYDLYVSCADADRAWVEGYLIPSLGISREHIITQDVFRLGVARVSEIERAVMSSRFTVLILSPAYLADEWSNLGELFASYLTTSEQQIHLIPLLKFECEVPPRIDFRVSLDCTDPAKWDGEIARLRNLLNKPVPPPENIPCPYPGMVPFRVEDAHRFYGRTQEIDELVRRIRVQNYLFVIGPSGSGKSSLVFAGLVAALDQQRSNAWLVKTIRPGNNPLNALERALAQAAVDSSSYAGARLLLIIDQFEEVFAQADKEKQAVFIARLKLLRAENHCTILIVLRADFYQDLFYTDLWPIDPSERVEIAPLRGAALAEAIVNPAKEIGVYLEPRLLERMLSDAANEPGVLPFVQETMLLLWEKRKRRLLSLQAYEELGQGNLSGLAVALATRADIVFGQLKGSQRTIARRIFLRLVQFGQGRADTRRQQPKSTLRASSEDPIEFDRTLQHLTDHRLLTMTGKENDADRQVDLAHEALITGWQRLSQWISEAREAEQTRRRLEDKAGEWVRLGGKAGLLDEVELREAEIWLKSVDATDLGCSETLQKLIDRSRAEQKQRAEMERNARMLQTVLTIGLAVLFLVSIAAASFAFQQFGIANEQRSAAQTQEAFANQLRIEAQAQAKMSGSEANVRATAEAQAILQRDQANEQTRISDSRRLTAQALLTEPSQYALALLLEVEAIRLYDNVEARGVLLHTVGSRTSLHTELNGNFGPRSDVWSVAFSPDGKTLASGVDNGNIYLWDIQTLKAVAWLKGHSDSVHSVIFSSDGKMLASGSEDNTTILWDVATRQIYGQPLRGFGHTELSVAFSPDGKMLASTVILRDTATGKVVEPILSGHTDWVFAVAFSPDGKVLATGSADTTIRFWDVATHQMIGQPLKGHKNTVRTVAFSPDGKMLASGGDDGKVFLWDVATRQMIGQPLRDQGDLVFSVAFSPDGKMLASGNRDKSATLWDVATRQMIGQLLTGHEDSVRSVAFSPDSKTLASGSGAWVFLWDVSLDSWWARACMLAGRNLTRAEWIQYRNPDPSTYDTVYGKNPTCKGLPVESK